MAVDSVDSSCLLLRDMLRPLQAVETVHKRMAAVLDSLS